MRRRASRLNWWALPAIVSAAYQIFAIVAAVRRLRARTEACAYAPPVSILKPVRGGDRQFARAIATHAAQDYPRFEILFGLSDPDDAARADIEALIRKTPSVPIRVVTVTTDAPNRKVGVLEKLATEAKHPVLLVNDSDISVEPDYLRKVVAPLERPATGLVTCLYRGSGDSFATRSEALGIATEFAPSVLTARELGVNEFAMGSTLAFRAADLTRAGGFGAIREYLADDYQLGKRLTRLGMTVVLADPVVETYLGEGSWRDVWRHQIRWARTIRVSRTGGYFGFAITHTLVWCILAAGAGAIRSSLICCAARVAAGLLCSYSVLRDHRSISLWWWMPMRDLFGFAVWLAGLFGSNVEWRGDSYRLERDGRLHRTSQLARRGLNRHFEDTTDRVK